MDPSASPGRIAEIPAAARMRPHLRSFDEADSVDRPSGASKGSHSSPMSWEEIVQDHHEHHIPRQTSAASASVASGPMVTSPLSVRSLDRLQSKTSADGGMKRRGSVLVSSEFIKPTPSVKVSHHEGRWSCWDGVHIMAEMFQQSKYISNFMVVAVLFDAYCTCSDIDARAVNARAPELLLLMSDLCLILYTFELAMAAITGGVRSIVQDWTMLLDIVIILCGYAELVLAATFGTSEAVTQLGVLRALRLVRIVRLMRLLRRTRALRELQKLVHMMATCMKALAWSFIFCFLIMTVWAMLLVELVHPLIVKMNLDEGLFQDCPECLNATRSVMEANLLLFKTVIAGDSWGEIAVPVIASNPATAVLFVGSQATIVFGVLNLIVAVVVDTFAEARQRDILNLAEELEYDSEKDKRFLQRIFDRMDENGKGHVTYEELLECARRDTEFQSRLRVMDIDEDDLRQLFEMIDSTGEGSIKADEFIAPLSRWVHDSKTAPRFIKYNLMRALEQQEELYVFCQDYFDNLGSRMDFLAHALQKMYENNSATVASTPGDASASNVQVPERLSESKIADLVESQSVVSRGSDSEDVEQPHKAMRPTLKVDPNHVVKTAMDSLESCVLKATEIALRSSLADVESTLRAQLRTEIPEIVQVSKPSTARFPRMSEFQRMRQDVRVARSSSCSGGTHSTSVYTSSFALGSTHLRDKERKRRPIGTFGPPKRKEGSKESATPTMQEHVYSGSSSRRGSKESRDDTRSRFATRTMSRARSLAFF